MNWLKEELSHPVAYAGLTLQSKPWKKRGVVWTALIALAAFIVGLFTSFGRDVDMQFYAAMAQVIPVLLVAGTVELAAGMGNPFEGMESARREYEQLQELKAEHGGKLPAPFDESVQRYADEPFNADGILDEARSVVITFFIAGFAALAASLIALAIDASTTFLLIVIVVNVVRVAREMVRHFWYRKV